MKLLSGFKEMKCLRKSLGKHADFFLFILIRRNITQSIEFMQNVSVSNLRVTKERKGTKPI